MYAGPKIVRDGLVFGYDTGANPSSGFDHRVNSRRYFKGKNTTNLQASGVAFGHASGTYGNVVTVADAPEKGTGWKKVTVSNRGSNFRIIQWTYTSMSANLEYWHSAVFDWGNMREKGYFINHDGSGTGQRYFYKPGGYDTNLGSSISINSSLEDGRIISKMIHTAAHTHAFFINNSTYNVSGLNDYFYYKEYQVEQSAYATPYVAGTRSASGSLIDLTKSSTIDVSNVSFGSDGSPTFDGTDDQIRIDDPGVGTSFSVELIIKVNDYSNQPIFISPNSVGIDHFFRMNAIGQLYARFVEIADSSADDYVSTTTISTSNYYHIVMSKSPSNGTLYINGISEDSHTPTLSAAAWTGDWRIGARWNSTYWLNGELPVLKVYNRALTVQEVQQNFKAYKNRFNI